MKRTLSSLSSQINEMRGTVSPKDNDTVAVKRQNLSLERSAFKRPQAAEEWCAKYGPVHSTDLVLHKRKLRDVRDLLEPMIRGESSCRILLLTGPAGCSKSSCIKLLAEELVTQYRWKSASTFSVSSNSGDPCCIEYDGSNFPLGVSKGDHFDQFLMESRYRTGSNLAVLLIEDLPNIFNLSTRTQFQQSLLRWLCNGEPHLPPLVISLSECELQAGDNSNNTFGIDTQFIAETVLGFEVLAHPGLQRIKFNPINKTLLKKHLNDISIREQQSFTPRKWEHRGEFVSSVVEHCGDIRSATGALQLWATSSLPIFSKNHTREQSISLFQSLGRVMYGSSDITDDNQMVNDLMLSNGLNMNDVFKLGLLENYSAFNKHDFPLRSAAEITGSLSLSDTMSVEFSAKSLAEATEYPLRAVRDTFSRNKKDERSSHNKSYFPRDSKVRKMCRNFEVDVDKFSYTTMKRYGCWYSFRNVALYFSYFAPFIRKRRNFKKKSLQHYISSLDSPSDREALIAANSDIFECDEQVDILSRVGGDLSLVTAGQDAFGERDLKSRYTSSKTLVLQRVVAQNFTFNEVSTGELTEVNVADELLDPIINSDDEDDGISFEDEDDDTFYDMLASQSPRKPTTNSTRN
ncbi:LADA_0F03862g1_1 [Lachancea dasiensis]|uniref:LADA_0F03862g1_1 n=1 Tax=Lachancea dasiensis TaxID=1072105 RepID=A0A1G4JJB3_9SACH|nr:LADA_0F03862g1_1 [Lachancea dasiensis]